MTLGLLAGFQRADQRHQVADQLRPDQVHRRRVDHHAEHTLIGRGDPQRAVHLPHHYLLYHSCLRSCQTAGPGRWRVGVAGSPARNCGARVPVPPAAALPSGCGVRRTGPAPGAWAQVSETLAKASSAAIPVSTPDGGTRVAYDSVASQIAPYHDAAASQVAQRLDTEVLTLLREVTGAPASGTT